MPDFLLSPMQAGDIPRAVALICQAMNPEEGRWAEKTMKFHFGCRQQGLSDGRNYYLGKKNEGHKGIQGISGLHHYDWGPEENVWLAWFAIDPEYQRQGLGRRLMALTEKKAVLCGYKKLLIETYSHRDFDKARRFYSAFGFEIKGKIHDYLPDGSEMVVYGKRLN